MKVLKFSDLFSDKLLDLGYSHCYFVAGGNIMHLLNSVRSRFTCIPFAHEVGAAIATEYHNASISGLEGRAFCLVTAGPGLTNAVTGVAGAWQESRELLIVGGQVKTADLASSGMRQRGIQEVNGVELLRSITKAALRIDSADQLKEALEMVRLGSTPRKGPVFLELPLDAQAEMVDIHEQPASVSQSPSLPLASLGSEFLSQIAARLAHSSRPVLLIGGGVERATGLALADALRDCHLPLMTTYNGADRIDNQLPNYFGRPNTWGMRYSNILLQQADLIIALGTRLGLQQTGFNWQEFAPSAHLIQVDIDPTELDKGHPYVDESCCGDANIVLRSLIFNNVIRLQPHQQEWLNHCQFVKLSLPLSEDSNIRDPKYINPYDFWLQLSDQLDADSSLVPCSSGSSFTSSYQAVTLPAGSQMLSNKSQAAMGYGLSGAIGVALANPDRRVFLVEGDGGFLQNIQELAVARKNLTNLGIFLWVNHGYASIRMTQKTYFQGAWLGCDAESGLGFPNWSVLFDSFDIPVFEMCSEGFSSEALQSFIRKNGLYAVLVPINPSQTFYPKISSFITSSGGMKSNPLHKIGPELPEEVYTRMTPYL
ncbi:thiamine pyrophosphate-binding protein [bacterium]|nr:thiamine pyrophosphate-binding protein [bacterium]